VKLLTGIILMLSGLTLAVRAGFLWGKRSAIAESIEGKFIEFAKAQNNAPVESNTDVYIMVLVSFVLVLLGSIALMMSKSK
jgi:hypothetical protein